MLCVICQIREKLKGRRYCSFCFNARKRANKKSYVCGYCKSQFESATRNVKYCTVSCALRDTTPKLEKTLFCQDCGISFIYRGRSKQLRCAPCLRKFNSKQVMIYRAKKHPEIKVGVGSGGNQQGEFNHQWNPTAKYHGITKPKYVFGYREVCFSIWKRECIICRDIQSLEVHHLDGNIKNKLEKNLIPLCKRCHRRFHGWFRYGKFSEEQQETLFFDWLIRIISKRTTLDGRSKIAEKNWNPEMEIRGEGAFAPAAETRN